MKTIQLIEPEDYQQIGNSRIGGKPDLPQGLDYPLSSNGFLEFIIQINLADHKIDGFPNHGLLSLFYGDLAKREALGFYFERLEYLETKAIPSNLPSAGVTDFRKHNSCKISIETIENNWKADTDEEIDFLYEHSYLFYKGLTDKNEMYKVANGFDLISYELSIDEVNNKMAYGGQNGNKVYQNLEDVKNCELTKLYENQRYPYKSSREEWLAQIEKFDRMKAYHIKRFSEYQCFLSLQSLEEVGMVWGDLGKLEFYGYTNDLKNGVLNKINAWMT